MASARIVAELTGRTHAVPGAPVVIETTPVMVAGDDENAVQRIRRILMETGYQVAPGRAGSRMMEDLRRQANCTLRQCPVELLVLEGIVRPWVALALVEVVRGVYPSLPIILCTSSDPEVRKEAKRLAVDVVFGKVPEEEELRRAALELAPILPEVSGETLN